jgi:hypothetical protein
VMSHQPPKSADGKSPCSGGAFPPHEADRSAKPASIPGSGQGDSSRAGHETCPVPLAIFLGLHVRTKGTPRCRRTTFLSVECCHRVLELAVKTKAKSFLDENSNLQPSRGQHCQDRTNRRSRPDSIQFQAVDTIRSRFRCGFQPST